MTAEGEKKRTGALRSWVLICAGVLLVGGGVGWAGATVLMPADDALDSAEFTYVEVAQGEVGSSITLNTVAEWTPVPAGSNLAAGVITSVDVGAGDEVGPGAILYTVNLRPVVIAQGGVPAFRSLSRGVNGADVAQLQELLTSAGLYSGPIDGGFGSATARAVRAWQTGLGVRADGVVQPGDIVFVPALPARIALDDAVVRGASVSGGEPAAQTLPSAPAFSIPVTEDQVLLMPAGTRVEIAGPEGEEWAGVISEQVTDDEDGMRLVVSGVDGATVCGAACGSVPISGSTQLRSRVVTVETVRGATVPSAALLTHPDGTVAVVDAAGQEHPVTVVASARGMSLIEGVELGLRVRLPGEA